MIDQTRHGAVDYGTLDNSSLHGVNEIAGFGRMSLPLQISSVAPYRRAPRPSTAPESFNIVLGLVQVDKKAAKKTAAMPQLQNPASLATGPKFYDCSIMRHSSLSESAETVSRVIATRNQDKESTPTSLSWMSSENGSCSSEKRDSQCLTNVETVAQITDASNALSQHSTISEKMAPYNQSSTFTAAPLILNQVTLASLNI